MRLRRIIPRFSLRTLMLGVLLAGSGLALWTNWTAWVRTAVLESSKGKHLGFIAFSADSKHVIGYVGNTTFIWDTEDGRLLSKNANSARGFETIRLVIRSGRPILCSAAQGTLDEAANDYSTIIHITDLESSELTNSFELMAGHDIRVSPDGNWLFFERNEFLLLWDIRARKVAFKLMLNETRDSTGIGFSANGHWITAPDEKKVRQINVYDARSMCVVRKFVCTDVADGVTTSPDGLRVVTDVFDGPIFLWNAETGEKIARLAGVPVYSSDSNRLFTIAAGMGGGDACLCNGISGALITRISSHIGIFSADSTRLLSASRESFVVYDAVDGNTLFVSKFARTSDLEETNTLVCKSPDERAIILVEESELCIWQRRRPEWWWGVAWLPEFWATAILTVALIWSGVRDGREFRKKKSNNGGELAVN